MAMGVSLVFLALFLSISVLMFHPLISSFANHNSNTNPLVYLAVHAIIFCIAPFQFFSAVILLFLRVAAPQRAFFIKHLARAARVLVSTTLLLAVPLVVHALSVSEILPPDVLMVMVVVGAAAVTYKCILYGRYVDLAGQTASSFVPAITALCISIGSFLFIDSFSVPLSDVNHESTLVLVPILLLVLSLDCLTFISAMVLLFLCIGMPANGPQNHPIAVGMIKNLAEVTSAICFTTTVVIALYMLVP